MTISYSFLHITLRSFHSQLCKHIVHPSTRTLQKFFFVPARDKGFVISRKYSTQTTRDIIIISNKLNQLPLLRTTIISESILRAAISRNIVSTNRKSLSKRRSAANSSRLDTWKVVMYRRFCIACYVSPQIVAEKFDPLRISLSLSLPLCVRVCVRASVPRMEKAANKIPTAKKSGTRVCRPQKLHICISE